MKNRHILIDFQHSFDFSCMDFENGIWLDTSVYLNGDYLIKFMKFTSPSNKQ